MSIAEIPISEFNKAETNCLTQEYLYARLSFHVCLCMWKILYVTKYNGIFCLLHTLRLTYPLSVCPSVCFTFFMLACFNRWHVFNVPYNTLVYCCVAWYVDIVPRFEIDVQYQRLSMYVLHYQYSCMCNCLFIIWTH